MAEKSKPKCNVHKNLFVPHGCCFFARVVVVVVWLFLMLFLAVLEAHDVMAQFNVLAY